MTSLEFIIEKWEIENFENDVYFEDDYKKPRMRTDMADDREFPIIAIPKSTTILQLENLLWWAKSNSESHFWVSPEDKKEYSVFELRMKPEYIKNLREELYGLSGFFIKKQGDKT